MVRDTIASESTFVGDERDMSGTGSVCDVEVVVDLAATGFLDTAGLSVLVDYARRLRERDAELVTQAPSRVVATVLELTGTRGLFRIRGAQAS